jgi:hypothetical protein
MNLGKWLLSAAVITVSACGAPTGGGGFTAADIKAGVPSGTLGDKSWTMTKAVVTRDSQLNVTLYADSTVADCGTGSAVNTVFWFQPEEAGERELGFGSNSQTITFYDGETNYVFVDGLINVSVLTGNAITIGLVAKTTKGNSINGTFSTTICP